MADSYPHILDERDVCLQEAARTLTLTFLSGMPNRLQNSSSPYLLQHAGNPVDWHPWGAEALDKARTENKPIILSIGYSACHWCHVMEKNCFENEEIAGLMNKSFINIKVDREERPDIDNLYMDALHLMGIQGGWPLNVFLTPDQLPFYGGTYFPPEQWVHILNQIARAHAKKPGELQEIGERNRQGLAISDHQRFGKLPEKKPVKEIAKAGMEALLKIYDPEWGGFAQAPKFPMPCVYRYLFHLSAVVADTGAKEMALFSLEKMAIGGIHDQLGGGFARYSVDREWCVPHFEKMLYDNAQLLSLFSIAWQESGKEVFRQAVEGIVRFVNRELSHASGGFFSALDADSDGEEGSYYVWTKAEVLAVLGKDAEAFARFYDLPDEGNFEHGKSVLRSLITEEEFIQKFPATERIKEKEILARCREKLAAARESRNRPALDDKLICSWNALMICGLCDAFRVFREPAYLRRAEQAGYFIVNDLFTSEGGLLRIWKNRSVHTPAFLDDYAHCIQAFTALSECSMETRWLKHAENLCAFTLRHFFDREDGLFFYTPDFGESLAARKKETADNVIPSSNAQMALAMNQLGRLLHRSEWMEISAGMPEAIRPMLRGDLRYASAWMQVLLLLEITPPDIVLYGAAGEDFLKTARGPFIPGLSIRRATVEEESIASPEGESVFALVCSGTHCLPPAASPAMLAESLRTFRRN